MSMRLLTRGAEASLNVRGAYLKVLGDLLGSIAVLVAGAVIWLTGWTPIDPIASVLIAVLILPRAWNLLREAVDVLLQATPKNINLDEAGPTCCAAKGSSMLTTWTPWTLTSGMPVVSAHVVIDPDADPAAVLDEVCRCLADDFDMEHSTIQLARAPIGGVSRRYRIRDRARYAGKAKKAPQRLEWIVSGGIGAHAVMANGNSAPAVAALMESTPKG